MGVSPGYRADIVCKPLVAWGDECLDKNIKGRSEVISGEQAWCPVE